MHEEIKIFSPCSLKGESDPVKGRVENSPTLYRASFGMEARDMERRLRASPNSSK